MAAQVFAFILHKDGKADDTALELAAASQRIAPGATPVAIVTGAGAAVDGVCQELTASYAEVWKFAGDALAYPNAEIIRTLLLKVLPKGSTLLLPHTTFGMDLGPGLAIKMDAAYVSDVTAIDGLDGATLKVVRQEFNGQVSAHLACDMSKGAVVSVRSGCFQPGVVGAAGGKVVDKSGEVGEISARRRFVEVLQAEVGDVDITKEDVLVSVGRGIGDKENLPVADDLAKAMGAVVSCSRPVVDAKWLEKGRQVGTSGKTVKPKVYLALGISGSFQHMGGLKGNPFIVAVNKNPKAPIFQVANVGVVADLLEFVPELTEKIMSAK
ncbi:MAG: electron transfer flavoprotein subunit alpha/FixB family protein [Desulfobacterales bacterium]|jgi:electron transfer flavoprotein alpha subunit|nr:electron transfer flavoprotein subunit alpha/FixB family protein [Desulfobacterales bacterium]